MLLPRTLVPLFEGAEGPSVGGLAMVDVVGVDGASGGGVEAGEDGTGPSLGGEGGELVAVLGASELVGLPAGGVAVGGIDETTGGIAGGEGIDGGVAVVVGGVAVLGGGVAAVVGGRTVVVGGGVAAVVGGRAVVVGGGVTLAVLGGIPMELLGADDGP
ncbi:hypothetical protein SO802_034312 [Lithocarpus litseifolius]|uniref:Uncharacterized protein n=1 Tax=Lithocarpus litseifolius TaxID=425828 RepID=A0AAW2BI74_9ROSI